MRSGILWYSVIDMNLNGGNGSVVQNNVILFNDTLSTSGPQAVKHANGRDWWIIEHKTIQKIL